MRYRHIFACGLVIASVLSACGKTTTPPAAEQKTAEFDIRYNVVGTKYNQYFELDPDAFLQDYNAELNEYNLVLTPMPQASDLGALFSANGGESWKVSLHLMGDFDAKLSADTEGWSKYIKEVELSLYSKDDATAKRNGQYVRALINTFTPGASEIVENALGLYGEPSEDALITDNVYRVTMENVSYVFMDSENSSGKFLVQPLDDELYESTNAITPKVIKPS